MKNYGDRLKAIRKFLGLTQDQVASVLNLTKNTIVNIENNRQFVEFDELDKFSKLYGVSMEEIISDKKKNNIDNQIFIREIEKLNKKDKQEVQNLIRHFS